MTTSPNPEHLLRRPKKPVAKGASTTVLAAGAVGVFVVVGAIVGFVVFGHGKSAASSSNPSLAVQAASVPVTQSFLPVLGSAAKHPAHKPQNTAKPVPGTSPTPAPTATPSATPSPAQTHDATAVEIAKAKHQAALHLAALRRAQSATQGSANASLTSTNFGGASDTSATQTAAPALVAVATPTPAPATATPDAQPTPVYAPRVVVDARFSDRVSPAYPEIAREQGAQGTAIVLATVGPRGNVISVQLDQSTGNKLLDQAALSAARTSRFEPPEIDGKPATETYRIVYTFDPNS